MAQGSPFIAASSSRAPGSALTPSTPAASSASRRSVASRTRSGGRKPAIASEVRRPWATAR